MQSLGYYIKHPKGLANVCLVRFGGWLPDKTYLKLMYRLQMGKRLNLKNPQTFCEKLQWLKLYDRKPEYTQMVDKLAVKDYVANIIGKEYIIPTLGVWNTTEEIEWDKLPNQFVLKTTHGGGGMGVAICKDKQNFDKQSAIKKLNKSMKTDGYKQFKEWPYKNVPKRIIAEKYMQDETIKQKDLPDYKFYCFKGEPKYCQVIQDRNEKEKIDFYNMQWQHQEFIGLNPNAVHSETVIEKPKNLSVMQDIAHKLSKDNPFTRVDLYIVNDKEYFGEITFYPASGFGEFTPDKYNEVLGKMIDCQETVWGGVFRIIVNDDNTLQITEDKKDLPDYKFFCFNGEPKYCQVITGRGSKMCIDFFDKDWNHQPFHEPKHYPFADVEPQKPQNFEQMWNAARELAKDKAFSRIDFYEVNKQSYFGEITFYPTSGFGGFNPENYDGIIGKMISLDGIRTGGGIG